MSAHAQGACQFAKVHRWNVVAAVVHAFGVLHDCGPTADDRLWLAKVNIWGETLGQLLLLRPWWALRWSSFGYLKK
jgi:hypothetical protein